MPSGVTTARSSRESTAGDQTAITAAAPTAPANVANRSRPAQWVVRPLRFSSSQRCDSGTQARIKNTKSAGNAPAIIRNRQA